MGARGGCLEAGLREAGEARTGAAEDLRAKTPMSLGRRSCCGRKPVGLVGGRVGRQGLNPLPSDLGISHPLPPSNRAGFAENEGKASQKRKPDNIQTLNLDSPPMDLGMSDAAAWTTAMNNLGMAPMGMTADPPLPNFDPALGMMTGIPPINPLMPGLGIVPPPILSDMPVAKEIVHCKSCTLFPPNPNLPPPTTRERPPGCKTVFVGGLPENGTEETIVEIFEKCGEIIALRKSKKHFCHIRFAEEYMVDKAVYLSGYRIRLGSSTDKKDTGRLHVDFAEARDDLYEWECKQRMLAREERHRKRKTEERFLPPSPPPVVNYSDYECSLVVEKLKVDAKFLEAVQTLLAWLERGEVNRRTANSFYTMVQSVNSHIRRLMNEKAAHDKEMEEAKEKFKLALSGILAQFEQIVAVYHSACKQKAWDHFTKAQRKNISVWCKQAEHLQKLQQDCERREAELEKAKEEKLQLDKLLERLKEKQEQAAGSDREKDSTEAEDQVDSDLSSICSKSPEKERLLEKGLHCNPLRLEREALLVGIISTFLHVHPFGASIEYICSYLQRLDSKICATEVENLMTRLQHTFKQEMNGVGASLEKRWKFCGFEGLKTVT
ncbi:ecto-NOX disulfide-thiol exchanger 2 isoform X5 [Ahaetulla prasina]|uniref:ecto-NOX disulfide-thiol exchanger 2 isoform X5 n=1 Tax=Ahaetulla prasina TaxID=499056 RepID=UPI00264A488F|nr:ecto-NOX disulfide-thiol exchanger 2 isoform X5 [Ahaetulla prasina]